MSIASSTSIGVGTHLTDDYTFDLQVEGTGAGGMGLVVWGPDTRTGTKLAAKMVYPARTTDPKLHASFRSLMLSPHSEEAKQVKDHLEWAIQQVEQKLHG